MSQHGKPSVTITFNGTDREIAYEPHESVSALLAAAKKAFAVENQHLLGLFNISGVEITDEQQSVEHAGVKPSDVLVLRQSTVKGG